MDDYGSGTTCIRTEYPLLYCGGWPHAFDSSAFTFREVSWAPVPSSPDSSALPGELLTDAVAHNLEDRRVLLRVFRKLAKDESLTRHTLVSLHGFLNALPRSKHLPAVSPDGEGGLTLAWSVPGKGRTLITAADGTLYVVGNAGRPLATYLPDVDFIGSLPDELLALIPE